MASGPANADQVVTHWTMPVINIAPADRPAGPNIFGTIALPVRARPTSTRWAKVMAASLNQPALARFTENARGLSPQEQASFVQSAVNHSVRNVLWSADCSDDGYWAPAQETLARGVGDCFDIAITKMEALRLLGIPDRDFYLTTGYFRDGQQAGRGHESVALMVRIGEQFWVLPEHSDHVIETDGTTGSSSEFSPIVTYGVGMTWVHGRVVKIASLGNVTGANPAK